MMQGYQKVKFTVTLVFISLMANTSVIKADTLEQAVNQTIATHPEILTAESLQNAASADIRQQQGSYLPRLDVTAGYGKETSDNPATRSATDSNGPVTLTRQESNFLLSQLLFDGGNVSNSIAKSRADYQSAVYQVYQTQEALAFAAAQSYLILMQDRELLRIAKLNVNAHQDIYQKIAKRVQGGAGKRSDLDLAESRLASALSNYAQSQGQVQNDQATFIRVVGYEPDAYLAMPPEPRNLPFNLRGAQSLAIQLNPTLAESKTQIASNQATVGVAKSAYFPKITLDLSAGFSDSLDGVAGYNNERQAMVRVNYNLFRGGSDKAAIAAARYRVVASEQDAKRLEREILETVALAWNNMVFSTRQIPELNINVNQSYNVWQAYIKQFQLGQRTLFDLLNAQAEYYTAQSNLVRAEYKARVNRYQLLASIGELVSTVKNPSYNAYSTVIQHPKSSLKKIHVTVPADASPTGPSPATNPTNPSVWQYPAEKNNTSLKVSPPPINSPKIPSLTHPSSLKKSDSKESDMPPLPAESTTTPASGTASPLSSSMSHSISEMDLSAQKTTPVILASSYSLQLLSAQKPHTLEQFANQHHLTSGNYHIIQHTVKNRDWYILSYGQYSSYQLAEIAQKQMTQEGLKGLIIKTG